MNKKAEKQAMAVVRSQINRPIQLQAVEQALLLEEQFDRPVIHGPEGISDARWRAMVKRCKNDGGTEKVAERM